jgi:DNA repair protein RadC
MRIVEAGKTMGTEVVDYIMVTKNGFFSFKEKRII